MSTLHIRKNRLSRLAGIFIIAAILLLGGVYLYKSSKDASAARKEDWVAGNIVSDAIFTDNNSMSTGDIQAFLRRTIGGCDVNGTGKAVEFGSNLTRAQYAASRGWQKPPYTCLDLYYEVPKKSPGGSMPANNYSNPNSRPTGSQSAAWIIKDAANRYKISPKTLLVKIATESAGPLTHDKWPLFSQYRYAMGARCPDSGPGGSANCDSAYAGFSIQMYEAARLIRYYLDNMQQPWWSLKKPYQNNSILWNVVERGCGASNVYIQNKATAALYTYTPYQPNQAALNNMYGTGDNCSAYGNRNFWRVFWDWFGNTRNASSYKYSAVSQNVYADSAQTQPLPYNAVLAPGKTIYATIKVKNTGNTTWSNASMRLGTSRPNDRQSSFANQTWLSKNRAAQLVETTVKPGETGTFKFSMTTPTKTGNYKEYFNVVIEGMSWLPDIGIYMPFSIQNTREVRLFQDASRTVLLDSASKVTKGEKAYVSLKIINDTLATIPSNAKIATTNPNDRQSILRDASWISGNRVAQVGKNIEPGQSATVNFTIQAPSDIRQVAEDFGLVVDGKGWLETNSIRVAFSTQEKPKDSLVVGSALQSGQQLTSSTGKYSLRLQSDGNLVLYSASKAIWASNTVGKGGQRLVLQSDGNLVLYSASKAVWATNTVGKGGKQLVLQSDGNLVLYSASRSVWASNTVGR